MAPPSAPLTDLAFNILVALTGEDLHGYALLKRLQEQEGREGLRTGTVYAALARLEDDGLVAQSERTPSPDEDGRRKYWTTTPAGRAAAREEAARLTQVLRLARAKALLGVHD